MGIESVAVYSTADRESAHVRLADRAICIGKPPPAESYLNIPRIIAAAEVANVDAIHPGYGFLAENSRFADTCRACNIEFIGPSVQSMERLGNKVECKKLAIENKVPTSPGSDGAVDSEDQAVETARKVGYPVIIKAASGGGGRGMRVAHNEITLRTALSQARQEAEAGFGDPTVYVEKFIERARHIEVQILGDQHGNLLHLFERDCTMQRRHQKIIEESPSPALSEALREQVCKAAVRLCKSVNYYSAGTVEFLFDPQEKRFYLMEVNTRMQVEHPVTELLTGVDIVKSQFRVAAGEKLALSQKHLRAEGHAIEARINAEDPERNFAPSPGRIVQFDPPGGPGVRIETHCFSGCVVPPNYDSMIAKLLVHAPTRDEALARMRRALAEFRIEPTKTTIQLHQKLMKNANFIKGDVDIHFVERLLQHKG
jgi:acetyl-CoA carboxylase biotin carboxylase subunit